MDFNLTGYGILWDMDGVIVDTGDAHFISWQRTFLEIGKEFSAAFFQETFGMNNAGILKLAFGEGVAEDTIRQVGDKKEILFREAIKGNVHLLPGVESWLKLFQKAGAKQAIASSGPPENIAACVSETGIQPYLDALVSGYDLPGKPNPDTFLLAAKELGLTPNRCLVIEDAIAGVEGANRAGMKCIAVATTNPRNVLLNADLIFGTLDEMNIEHIKSILSLHH